MNGLTYVPKGYSNYTDDTTQEGGYAHGSNQGVKRYMFDNKALEHVRVPASRYTKFKDEPSKFESNKEFMPKYTHEDHHEDYELSYGLENEDSSPTKYLPTIPYKYRPTSPHKYRPRSPTKYQQTSPTRYRPTNPYQPTSPTKYQSTSPTRGYPSKEDYLIKAQNFRGPNKHRPTSSVYTFPSKDGQEMTQSLSNPNKHNHSIVGPEYGRHVRFMDYSSPGYRWQNEYPHTTHRQLTTLSNYNSLESYPRAGEFDNLSARAKPIKPEWFYTPDQLRSNTINSLEAMKRYNGAYVP